MFRISGSMLACFLQLFGGTLILYFYHTPNNTPKYPQMQANIKGLLRTIKVLIFLDNKGFNEYYWILLELEVAEPGPERICTRSTVSEDCWHVSLPNGSSRLVLLEKHLSFWNTFPEGPLRRRHWCGSTAAAQAFHSKSCSRVSALTTKQSGEISMNAMLPLSHSPAGGTTLWVYPGNVK